MSGVNFDKKSAVRIAKVLRTVEGRTAPSTGPNAPRHNWGGTGSGGGRGAIELVAALPAIPDEGTLEVRWGTAAMIDYGTGDGQVWETGAGETKWYPRWMFTNKSGTPV